ncbi:MAG: bifunctional glutamate N-acetyltransferase/amino-acid acetyltransferase ArgJ [Solirubrobacteraceae bacterium]|nr:bifunctional glutamate N-acetyltransferase/amino-acid acetyltransferase ArgJ [Solirubrobacteraceae bacterium]
MNERPDLSRWLPVPEGVTLSDAAQLPAGFRAGAAATGSKPSGALDLGVIMCDEASMTSAAHFTPSAAPAAPVVITRDRCTTDKLRAVFVNSGNANAATGRTGFEEAARTQGATSILLGLPIEQVGLCSTGKIGEPLDGRAFVKALPLVGDDMSTDATRFNQAICTTDLFLKKSAVDVALKGGTVRIVAQAKGAGMIHPGFATMLCFVQTDARLGAGQCDRLLRTGLLETFNRVSVDGQMSTNDTAVLQASGASGIAPEDKDEDALVQSALSYVLLDLALQLIADGEGATRLARVTVKGGDPQGHAADKVADAISTSPLVQTALTGADPNWGRIVQAAGHALAGRGEVPFSVSFGGVQVCNANQSTRYDVKAAEAAAAEELVEIGVSFPGDGEAVRYFCDLTVAYVRFNSEYTT